VQALMREAHHAQRKYDEESEADPAREEPVLVETAAELGCR
jgi:hypothetical protein